MVLPPWLGASPMAGGFPHGWGLPPWLGASPGSSLKGEGRKKQNKKQVQGRLASLHLFFYTFNERGQSGWGEDSKKQMGEYLILEHRKYYVRNPGCHIDNWTTKLII